MWPFTTPTTPTGEDTVTATQNYYKHQLAILERQLSDSSSEYKRLLAAKNEALKLRAAKCKSLESQIEEQRLELQRFRCIVTAEENLKRNKKLYSSVPREGSITEMERLKLELLETKEERNTRTLQALRVYQAEAKEHLNQALEQCRRENDKRTDRLLKEALVQRFSAENARSETSGAPADYNNGGAENSSPQMRVTTTSHLVTLAELSRLRLELEDCYRRLETYEPDVRNQSIKPTPSTTTPVTSAPTAAAEVTAEAQNQSKSAARNSDSDAPRDTSAHAPPAPTPAPTVIPKEPSAPTVDPPVALTPMALSPGGHSGRNGMVSKSIMRKILLSYVARNHCKDVLGLAAAVLNCNAEEKELAGLEEKDNGILGYLFSPRTEPESVHSSRFIEKRAARRLLVGYMESVRLCNKVKAKNILAVMDDILAFTNDERTRIGMKPKSSSGLQALAPADSGTGSNETTVSSLDEEWVNFLLRRHGCSE